VFLYLYLCLSGLLLVANWRVCILCPCVCLAAVGAYMVCLANSFAVLFLVLIVSVSGCKVLCLLGTHAVFVTRHGNGIVTRFVGMHGARLSASPYC